MSYPVYKGQNPKHLVSETEAIVNRSSIPTLKSPTTFGNQMVCIANYFLSKEVRETGVNTGKFIDEWNRAYAQDDKAFDQQSAWCAIFMWKIAEESSRLLSCANPFPNYKEKFFNPETKKEDMVWGNARKTVEYLTEKGVKFTKSVPVVGCMMFRNSKSASSSGHWGIVTDVSKDTFRTIEGNITLSNNIDGVGYWEYPINEILNPENGILFANVQDSLKCNNQQPLQPYQGWICQVEEKSKEPEVISAGLPKCIEATTNGNYRFTDKAGKFFFAKLDTATAKWVAFDPNTGKWNEVINCEANVKTLVETETKKTDPIPETKQEYFPSKDTSTPKIEKVKKCRFNIVSVPDKSRLQHYSVLRDKYVLADITGAKIGSDARRNGSALWYNHTDQIDPKAHTGFGMFRDTAGNTIFCIDNNQPQSSDILKTGFLGYQVDGGMNFPSNANVLWVRLDAKRYNGGGWKENFVTNLSNTGIPFGQIGDRRFFEGEADVYMPSNSNLNKVVNWKNLSEKTLFSYLKAVESKGEKLKTPIVIYINERDKPPSWADKLNTIVSVATTLTNIVGIPIPQGIIQRTATFVKVLAGEEKLPGGLLGGLQMAAQLGEYYAPETVKGINTYVEEIKTDVGSFLKQGLNSVTPFFGKGNMDLNRFDILKEVESNLGLDVKEIEKLFKRYTNVSSISSSIDLTKIVGSVGLTDLNKTVENISNMFMLDTMRRHLLAKGGLVDDIIISSNPIADVPIIQDLFASAGSNSVLSTFPKIQEMTNELLGNSFISDLIEKEVNAPDIKAALIGQVFGNIPIDKNILKPLQLEALKSRAYANKNAGDPFILPESVSEEYKECYQFVIEQETGAKVINCPPNWEWDKQLKKCVNPNGSSGWTGTATTNNSGSGIIAPAGKSSITPEKKSSGNAGSGFDFGGGFDKVAINLDIIKKTGDDRIEIGKKLPPDFIPTCLVFENGAYYFYPYGKPTTSQKASEVITTKPNTTIIQNPNVLSPYVFESGKNVINPVISNQKPISLAVPKELLNQSILSANQTAPKLLTPTLADLPQKIMILQGSNGEWYGIVDGVKKLFDPVNCVFINEIIDNEKSKEIGTSKDELERELAKREQERQKAEKAARDLQAERERLAKNEAERRAEIANNQRIIDLQKENARLKEESSKKQVEIKEIIKEVPNQTEIDKYIRLINDAGEREQEAKRQLNIEKLKSVDETILTKQIEGLEQSNKIEKEKYEALQREVENLKNKPAEVKYIDRPTAATQTVNPTVTQPNVVVPAITPNVSAPLVKAVDSTCTDCDKLKMPKKIMMEYIYDYGISPKCGNCGDCNGDCDCGCE